MGLTQELGFFESTKYNQYIFFKYTQEKCYLVMDLRTMKLFIESLNNLISEPVNSELRVAFIDD